MVKYYVAISFLLSKVVTNVGVRIFNMKASKKGRPKKVICYDNGIVLLLNVSDQEYFFVKEGKLYKSSKFPQVGKKVAWFSLSAEQREGVLKYYERIWQR